MDHRDEGGSLDVLEQPGGGQHHLPSVLPWVPCAQVARFRLGDRARLLPLVRVGPRQQPPFVGGRGKRLGGAEVEHGERHERVRVPPCWRPPCLVPVPWRSPKAATTNQEILVLVGTIRSPPIRRPSTRSRGSQRS